MAEVEAFVGIDLGGTDIKSVVLAPDGQVVWRDRVATGAMDGRDAVVDRLVDVIERAERAVAPAIIRGAGFAIPGVLDYEEGRVELLTNFPAEWNGFALQGTLETRVQIPIVLLNDVQAATVAEHTWGAGRGYADFVCIAIGTGIGGGIVLDGRLYLGSRGAAGEIGHQTMVPDGPRCNCGNHGCLEALASGYAIAREARMAVATGDTALATATGSENPTPAQIAQAAAGGNGTAQAIFARAGEAIGRALANVICVLNPRAIVVGGGVAEAGELLLRPIREEIERRTFVFSRERGGVEVIQSPFGGEAGAMGAAAWVMQPNVREIR